MATRNAVVTAPDSGILVVTWSGLTFGTTDVGNAQGFTRWADKTVQMVGTLGVGGEATIEGSNDGTTWGILTDPLGVDLILVDGAPVVISQNPLYIRPNMTGGDGSTSVSIIIVGKG